jgi:hypothetical protein
MLSGSLREMLACQGIRQVVLRTRYVSSPLALG